MLAGSPGSAFALMLAAAAVLIGFAELASLAMVVIGAIGACLMLAGSYEFLARRGVLRWLAAAVVIATPIAILVLFALNNLIWVALVSMALMVLAAGAALWRGPGRRPPGMPAREVQPPKRAFVIMNPGRAAGRSRSSG